MSIECPDKKANKSLCRFRQAIFKCLGQSIHGRLSVYVSAHLPADALSAAEIQDHREMHVLMQIRFDKYIRE